MNKRTFCTTLGWGALSAALIALPGVSAKTHEAAAQSQDRINQLEMRGQEPSEWLSEVYEGTSGTLPGEEDLQVSSSGGGWLGVGFSEITTEKAKEMKLPAERGALLGKIIPDSPAAKAGLKQNDVVTEINGQRVEGTAQFRRMIREIPAGRTAQLTVWRDGKSQSLSVTIGKSEPHASIPMSLSVPGAFALRTPQIQELQELPEMMQDFNTFEIMGSAQPRLGIDAENLEGDFGHYFGAPDGEGVLIRSVFADTPAAKAGLKAGDVVTSVNGERVRSISDLREKLAANKDGKTLKLGLLRNKAELSVNVEVPAPTRHHEHHTAQRTNI